MNIRRAALFFVLLTAIYIALSPLSMKRMGYEAEQVRASRGLISRTAMVFRGDLGTDVLTWPRHGLLEPIIQVPFVLVGQTLFGPDTAGEDVVLSLQPIVASSLLCTIVFIWVRGMTGSARRATALGLATGLTTMVWPYAYIGIETTQSLFLLLAGYLALGAPGPPSRGRAVAFALSAAVAVSVKAGGPVLFPAVAWLLAVQWKRRGFGAGLGVTVAVIAATYLLSEYWRGFSPGRAMGTAALVNAYRVDGLTALTNVLYIFAAPNKGLLVYCPVLLPAIASIGRAYREDPATAVFAMLVLGGLATGTATVLFWSDEVWGPRYLHSTVAPMVVCLGVARRGMPMAVRREVPLIAAAVAGAVISSLGVLFYYGTASMAARAAGQTTLEDIQHDPEWNPIRLHASLVRVWLRGAGAGPAPWPPERHHWFPAPDEPFAFQPSKVIDLRDFAEPQPYLLRTR